MTEVTRPWRWLPRRRTNGWWEAEPWGPREAVCVLERRAVRGLRSDYLHLDHTEMKRKVANAGKLRLSPNEEAFILKEDYERRRKLRLLQVREQERDIALQIREDIKQRRNRQFSRLAEELRAEWEESQTQKIRNLEKLYLASLKTMGEGHRQAKENEPDFDALARRAAERKRKAQVRHKEALKLQKSQKEMVAKEKTWHIQTRKEALLVEKERSAKIASLPPPPPALFENIDIKRSSAVKPSSSTYHHLSTFVSRETHTKQTDAHVAAEEEAKRLDELQKQAVQERKEQCEKAHIRGFQAMQKIHLAQSQEKVMKELQQLQQEDLARRRQTVAQMPPQLVELPYKRSEMKEDWQRELEFAFEDMYNADRKVKGNLILHLEPEPLPTVTDQIQDEELDLSMEQEDVGETQNLQVTEAKMSSEPEVPFAMKTKQVSSKIIFKKLLNKIRNQKSLWTIKSLSEDESEVITTVNEIESKASAAESGTEQEQEVEGDKGTIESGTLASEDVLLPCQKDSAVRQEINETLPVTPAAPSSVLLHPQEAAARVRMSARQKQIMEIEEQKQKQLELLEQIEQQKLRLEIDCFRAQLEEEKRKKSQQTQDGAAPVSCSVLPDEDSHRQMIRNYQHQLLQQNRLHKQSIETARKRLLEYQSALKGRCPSMSATSLVPDSVISASPQKSRRHTAVTESWDHDQRPRLSPKKYQPTQLLRSSKSEPDHLQVQRQNHFQQKQVETAETLSTPDVPARRALESQELGRQFTQTEAQQRDYAYSKPAEPSLFLPLVPQHSFSSLPIKIESRKIHEPFATMSKSTVTKSHSVINQMRDRPLPFPETITAHQHRLKFLQEQLDLQKEALQARQEAQEQLLLCKQKQLEEQIGLSLFLPLDSSASLPCAKAESGRIEESSPVKDNAALSSGDAVVAQLQDKHLSFSPPVLPQQANFKFLQEKLNIQRDNLQARREAQELQSELDGRVGSEQGEQASVPIQVSQRIFASPPSLDTRSRKIQEGEQLLPKTEKGLLSSQDDSPKSQAESSSLLRQFLPLHDSLKLLKEQLVTQRDALQARHEAHMKLLAGRQRYSRDIKPVGMSCSFSPMVFEHSFPFQDPAKAETRRIDMPYSSQKEPMSPSHRRVPAFQDKSFSFPQQDLTAPEEQSHIQRVILGTGEESQPEQSELEKRISPEQSGISSSLSQVTDSERFQEFVSLMSDSTGTLSHPKIPRFPERVLEFSQHVVPVRDNLKEQQEKVDTEKATSYFNQNTQTGLPSFMPRLGQLSSALLPLAEPSTSQAYLSTESDTKIPSSQFQIPELQDRLLRISQLIQPQQDNLNALQQQLAAQREAIFQLREGAQEELLTHRPSERKGKPSPEHFGTSSSPETTQHPFASFPLLVNERIQEASPNSSDYTISSSHSEMQRLPDRLLGLSHSVLPQQDNLISPQEHLHAQTDSLPSIEKAPKEFILPKQDNYEGEMPSDHFSQTHHDDLKALQQQLDVQREAIRSRQEVQEELLFERLSNLEKRVSSEQVSSSSFLPLEALPVAGSQRTQKCFPTEGTDTLPSSQPEIPRSQHRRLSLSPPVHRQGEVTAQVCSSETPQELLLNSESKLSKSESAHHSISSCLFEETEHLFIPLPFAEGKSKTICELHSSKIERAPPPSNSLISSLQDRHPVLSQQDNLGVQKHVDFEREVLCYSQLAQQELLVQTETTLQQQIQKHQEILKDFFKSNQTSNPTNENDVKMQKMEQLGEWLPHARGPASSEEGSSRAERSSSDDDPLLSEHPGAKLSGKLGSRSSKPPVAQVKCGLDVKQHELSAIQEVESPASVRTSIPGKPDFSQDRDPLRVSVSREQSFLGNLLPWDPLVCLQTVDDDDTAVQVKESEIETHAILSFAMEEEYTCPSSTVKSNDKAETQEISPEPISSGTLSTGSFLSYENIDLSLTDSEHMDNREQESGAGEEDKAAVDLDFPELEHIFPNLHRQLFKPLEPHPDSALSPSSSGISQDNGDFYQILESSAEIRRAPSSSQRSVSVTALRRSSLNQPTDPAVALPAVQTSSTEHTGEPEQSFQQLLPEFSSQEGNQHVDLPSIFSVEAREPSEGTDDQNYLSEEQSKILQNKKAVHFQLSAEHLSSVCSSSDEANMFGQVHVNHSTPCGSTSSECSIKQQLEGKERLHFVELSERSVKISQRQEITENEKNKAYRAFAVNPRRDFDSRLCVTMEKGPSVQISPLLTIQSEKCFETSATAETPDVSRNLSQPAISETAESFCLQSSVPIWETESGHGIMEEPELTLVSISDISITETDFANLTLEENEAKNSFQVNELLPPVSECSLDQSTTAFAETLDTIPGSLQEAFLKRKKSFIERSYQRQKEIRNKAHVRNSQMKATKEKLPTGSFVNCLKGVNRVSISEDRKTAQSLMHQRALRLHNQLAEVKKQKEKEEKTKQEVYAKNRASAKEFHKKVLQKLRAKNT
ncbi:centrosomal protein of 295 kDa [Ochotona princeps]|uniref:centrosomal protein of 295 kDa n=1 Tax=Ochotona princeps TaxID=9978 RepID=UPI002714EF2B|nr:centrosomal protein of 295 kDa [Ochotona princeps]